MDFCDIFMELSRLENEAGKQEIFFAESKEQRYWAAGFREGVGRALDLLHDYAWEQEIKGRQEARPFSRAHENGQ